MSLAIEIDRITSVKLRGDPTWYPVEWRQGISSFVIDAHEFLWQGEIAWQDKREGRADGATWLTLTTPESGKPRVEWMACQMLDIEAVRYTAMLGSLPGPRAQ